MNIEAIVFLIIIGIIVILTITDKSDAKNEGVIDFKTSHDINGDIKKLKTKIKDDAKNARDTKRLLIVLIVIISVILLGFIVVVCDLIFKLGNENINNSNNILNNKDDVVIKEDINNDKVDTDTDKDKDKNKDKDKDDKEKDKLDITLNKLGEVSDYIKESQEASPCDMTAIEKDINYHKQEILDGVLDIYLVKDNKYTKLENPDTIKTLLEDYFRSKSYKKLFTINGDGILVRYIYICE